jgi:hypothetical protein
MKTAIDPTTKTLATVPQYLKTHGSKLDSNGDPRIRPSATCPVCDCTMHIRSENAGIRTDATFAHNHGKQYANTFCPLKLKHGDVYKGLTPSAPDIEAGTRLRAAYLANWQAHWQHIKSLVVLPDIRPFIKAIKALDKERFWQHKGLTHAHVTYAIVTLHAFAPPRGKAKAVRKDTIRFWFDQRVRSIEAFWNKPLASVRLVKATYSPRNGGRAGKELSHSEFVPINLEYQEHN